VVLVSGPSYGALNLQPDGGFTYTPQIGFNLDDSFTYKVSDGNLESSVVRVDLYMDTPLPWHNGLMPLDVNKSGHISPLDALTVINALNVGTRGWLPVPRPRPLVAPFYDTNGDKAITPLDALLVINYLNRNQTGGEGESDGGLFNARFAAVPAYAVPAYAVPAYAVPAYDVMGHLSLLDGTGDSAAQAAGASGTVSVEQIDRIGYDELPLIGTADADSPVSDEVWRSAGDDEETTWSDLFAATWFVTESEAD
jgi:hypothetical protein